LECQQVNRRRPDGRLCTCSLWHTLFPADLRGRHVR
jgi:hypothetical protein